MLILAWSQQDPRSSGANASIVSIINRATLGLDLVDNGLVHSQAFRFASTGTENKAPVGRGQLRVALCERLRPTSRLCSSLPRDTELRRHWA
jgi:hypothetical protein